MKQLCWGGIIICQKTTTPQWDSIQVGQFKQPRTHMFGMQPYINQTRRNMENDLNIFKMEADLNFSLN